MRKRAIMKIKKDKPLLSIGGPMCTGCSPMMNFNGNKMGVEEKEKRMHAARKQKPRQNNANIPPQRAG